MSAGSEVPAPSTPRTWRARVFVTASDQRLRLPRDLIGAATGAAVAAIAWLFVAAGVDAPVAVAVPTWISWLVTGVAVCGTTAFIVAAVLLCILARRFSLVGHVVVAAGGAALVAWGVAHWLGRGTPAAPPLIAATFATRLPGHPDPRGPLAHAAVGRGRSSAHSPRSSTPTWCRSGPSARRPSGSRPARRCPSGSEPSTSPPRWPRQLGSSTNSAWR